MGRLIYLKSICQSIEKTKQNKIKPEAVVGVGGAEVSVLTRIYRLKGTNNIS